jgi:hypothetical protein
MKTHANFIVEQDMKEFWSAYDPYKKWHVSQIIEKKK